MQKKYREKFPNARQHLALIPPVVEGHVEANASLQKLAMDSGSNVITNKPFLDRATGKLRANLTKGTHYTDWGVKLIAKEIKKSLYSKANIGNNQMNDLQLMTQERRNATKGNPAPLNKPNQRQPNTAPSTHTTTPKQPADLTNKGVESPNRFEVFNGEKPHAQEDNVQSHECPQ